MSLFVEGGGIIRGGNWEKVEAGGGDIDTFLGGSGILLIDKGDAGRLPLAMELEGCIGNGIILASFKLLTVDEPGSRCSRSMQPF